MLKVSSLHVHYGTTHVLHGVDLEVDTGRIVCLIGRDGASKNTTLKTIWVFATLGEILFAEQRIEAVVAHHIARMRVAYMPEDRRPFGSLSVKENIRIVAQASPRSDANDVNEAPAFFPEIVEREVLVIGHGRLDLLQTQMLHAKGSRVDLLDRYPEKMTLLAHFGVPTWSEPAQAVCSEGKKWPVVVEGYRFSRWFYPHGL